MYKGTFGSNLYDNGLVEGDILFNSATLTASVEYTGVYLRGAKRKFRLDQRPSMKLIELTEEGCTPRWLRGILWSLLVVLLALIHYIIGRTNRSFIGLQNIRLKSTSLIDWKKDKILHGVYESENPVDTGEFTMKRLEEF